MNEKFIRLFCATWQRLDATELASFFVEDGVYHNMPIQPVHGRVAVRQFIAAFIANWTAAEFEIVSLSCTKNIVFVERRDHITIGDRRIILPCCGVFEITNGRIAVWRDYFDMATYTEAQT